MQTKKMQIESYRKFFYTHKIDVKTTTLSEFVRKKRIKRIKLFKLEAEGFEPKYLKELKEILQIIELIAIDGGYERGKNQEEHLVCCVIC